MKNQRPLSLVSVSQSRNCPFSPLPRPSEPPGCHLLPPSNLSSTSPSTPPHFPFPDPLLPIPSPPGCQLLPGDGLATATQSHPFLPIPLCSSNLFTSPSDPFRAPSFPHLFPSDCFCSPIFPSLPYGFHPPPPLLSLPTLPRCRQPKPGTSCAMKCPHPLLLHTPSPPRCQKFTVSQSE